MRAPFFSAGLFSGTILILLALASGESIVHANGGEGGESVEPEHPGIVERNPLVRQRREQEAREEREREERAAREARRREQLTTHRDRRHFVYGPVIEVVIVREVYAEQPEKAIGGAWVLLERGAYREGRTVFRELLNLEPRKAELMIGRSLSELFLGEPREAVRWMEFALRRVPEAFGEFFLSLEMEAKVRQRLPLIQSHQIPFLEEADRYFLLAALAYLVEEKETSRAALRTARALRDRPALENLHNLLDPPGEDTP